LTARHLGLKATVILIAVVVGVGISYWLRAARVHEVRRELFELLQPVAVANCNLERFGETYDGGYLMCANLLADVVSGYSYGISGYDKWGCDISTKADVTVHQYDCFDDTRPVCTTGRTVFHDECVGGSSATTEGRLFDTIQNQFTKNGDRSNKVVMKIDVEGAEWDSFLAAPDDTLRQIDQLAVEFHGVNDERYIAAVRRLKQFFEVAHLHFNNVSCTDGLDPFPAWAYEVLFVNKRLAVVDRSRRAGGANALDARNNPLLPDCQR
jgi:hypothetical protein